MKSLYSYAAAVLLTLTMTASLPASVVAESKDGAAPVATRTGAAKISKEVATNNALAALPGTVTDVTVEKKRGKNVWVVEIVSQKDGAETDVLVDMDSGAVIGMDH
jgi:uncharacterized membrane protein YkoI